MKLRRLWSRVGFSNVSPIISSHNNLLLLLLQNSLSPLNSVTLCPETLAYDQNLLVYLTSCVRIDICEGVGATTVESWRSSRKIYAVGGRNNNCHRMEGPLMTFVFHHGGKFKKDEGGNLYYEPYHTEVLMVVDSDAFDVFFVNGYFKELGYAEARECWWKSPGVPLESGLRRLATDHDLIAMVKDCRRNFNLINLYFEHGISEPFVVDEKEKDMEKKISYSKPRNITLNPTSYHLIQKHALNPRRPQLMVLDYPLNPQSCLLIHKSHHHYISNSSISKL